MKKTIVAIALGAFLAFGYLFATEASTAQEQEPSIFSNEFAQEQEPSVFSSDSFQ